MENLNNLDIFILIVVALSALIALSRGLIKEVLSIIGWTLSVIAVIYLLPIVNPVTEMYISSPAMAGVVSSFVIVIIFFLIWIILTGFLIGKVRKSKLSGFDRVLGLFFGIFRAFLLVILFNILISWMVPKDKQSELLTDSKYFTLAGTFAEPIEALIPESTLEKIRAKSREVSGEEVADDSEHSKTDVDVLFEMLAQPRVASKHKTAKPVMVIDNSKANKILEKEEAAKKAKAKDNAKGKKANKSSEEKSYDSSERNNLNRLIETTVD